MPFRGNTERFIADTGTSVLSRVCVGLYDLQSGILYLNENNRTDTNIIAVDVMSVFTY